jgi:phosphoglycolate phosphatase
MRRRFDLLVFDWDGTLMDSAAGIAASLQAACRDLGVTEPSEADARYIIGLGLVDALRRAVPHLADHRYPALVERYGHHFRASEHAMRLFDGATAMLERLEKEGFLLAIATGKSRRGLDRALNATGLRRRFHLSRCADEAQSKPHPAMLLDIMAQVGVPAARTLMIGDTTHDLEMARNAGVEGLAMCHGAHPREALEGLSPLTCCEDIASLEAWIGTNA